MSLPDKPTPDLAMMAQQIAHMTRLARASGLHRIGDMLDQAAVELEQVRAERPPGKVVPLVIPGRPRHDGG